MQIKNKLNNINERLLKLNDDNNKVILECIINLADDNCNLYYYIKVLNRFNKVIETSDKIETPNQYITDYLNKYKCNYDIVFFDIKNGIKIPKTSLKYEYCYN